MKRSGIVPRLVRLLFVSGIFIFSSGIFAQAGSVSTRNYFDELTSERKPILGSEKEDKYAFRFPPFASVESWGPHYSLQTLLLFSYTNYPRFKEVSFFPLYNYLWAKDSDSYRQYLFPFFLSQKIENNGGVSGFHLSLLHYKSYEYGSNFSEESWRFPSFLPLAGSDRSVLNGKENVFRYAVPFLFFQKKSAEVSWTQFLLFHSGKDQDSSYGSILPLLFWGNGGQRRHLSFLPFWIYDSNETERRGLFLTPFFGRVWKDHVTAGNTDEERFSYFLLYFRNSHRQDGDLKRSTSMIPLVFFRRYEQSAGTFTNLLLLSGWNSDKAGEYKGFYLFPFVIHNKGENFSFFPAYFDTGERKFGLLPLPFYYEKKATYVNFYALNLFYSSNWRGETNFLFFPLFYRNSREDGATTVAPFFYRNSDGASSQNYFLNTYASWDRSGEFQKAIVFPLFYHSKRESGHTTLGPLFYQNKEGASSQNYFLNTYVSWDESGAFSKFVFFPILYRSKMGEEYTTILPLIYRRSEGLSSDNYFLNSYVSWNKSGELERTVVFPFIYYKAKEYFHFFPLYFDTNKEKFGLLPVPFYHYDDEYTRQTYAVNMFYASNKSGDWSFLFFPLFYHSHTALGNTTVAPFFYRKSEGVSSQNYIVNSYFSRDRLGKMDQAIFFPFVFYKADDYLSILPFYIRGKRETGEYTFLPELLTYWDEEQTLVLNTYHRKDKVTGKTKRFTFFPFWSYGEDEGTRSYLLFPLFYRTVSESQSRTISPLYYSFHSPEEDYSLYFLYETHDRKESSTRRLYPIYFSGSDKDSSYWNVLGLAGRGFDEQGDAKYSYAFPLYFYKRDSYRVLIPLFFRWGNDETHYRHFGIFHYWNRSPTKDNTWIWPALWFSNVDKVKKEEFTTWFPFYWNWNTPRSKGDIFLPFYLNYEEADKSLRLFLAYSHSQSLGNFAASAGISSNEKDYYIDTDIGFFYNLFSISKRTAIEKDDLLWWRKNHQEEQAPGAVANLTKEEKKEPEEKSGLNQYNRLSREKVRSFWGITALFGIFSYEEGDDRRHFRLLPLSWYSWSKKSKDKVFALPLYFHSQIGDESYRVLFPFFGEQTKGEDYLQSYLLLGFLNSKQGETRDFSILWPITRLYYSPDSWGIRFFPLFAHDQTKNSSRTVSPLYLSAEVTEGNTTDYAFHSLALPLVHATSRTIQNEKEIWKKGSDMFLPFYIRSYVKTESSRGEFYDGSVYTLLSWYSRYSHKDGRSYSYFFSPFYYSSRETKSGQTLEDAEKVDFALIPGFYWSRSPVQSTFFLLGYYREKTEFSSSANFLGIVSSSDWNIGTRKEESFRIFPFYFSEKVTEGETVLNNSAVVPILFAWNREKNSKSLNILGFVHSASHEEPGGSSSSKFLSPLYFSFTSKNASDAPEDETRLDFLPIPGFYWERNRRESTFFLLGYYSEQSEYHSEKNFLGLIASEESKFTISGSETKTEESFRIFPFYFSSSAKKGEEIVSSSRTVPILFHRSREGENYDWNILGIFGGSKSNDERSFAVYPFYSFSEDKKQNRTDKTVWGIPYYYDKVEYTGGNWSSFALNPLGVFHSAQSDRATSESSFWFLPIPGLYFEKTQSPKGIVDREWSFLQLITYKSQESLTDKVREKSEFSAFFLAGAESSSQEASYGVYSKSKSYLFPLFWLSRVRDANLSKTHFNFLILFDYEKGYDTRWIAGPAFYYSDSSSQGFGLFPILFRHKESTSDTLAIFPLLYRKWESTYSFWFALGAYGYSDQDESRWGFAGLLDTSYENKAKRRNLNLFLGLIHTELEEARTRVAILGGVLGGYEGRPDYSDANFLWLRYRSSPGDTLANFLPLYYYHRDADGTASLVPPVLGYFSSEKDGRFDMLGLGLLYYRHQRISREEDLMLVGPGLFYYKQTPTAMGLHSMGILALPLMGGLLWDWEYETRSSYSRYSILNVLYSRTTRKDGSQFSRILGFKIE